MFIKSILGIGALVAALTFAPQPDDLTGIKCVVKGKRAAVASTAVQYKDGKVYLCCGSCAEAFKKDVELADKAKFTVKANHQLVLTGQYVQKGCPFSGGAVDENLSSTVGGVEVGFCCADCQAKIDGLETIEEKVALLFSDSSFNKAFGLKETKIDLTGVKCMMMPAKDVVADQVVQYKEGKVFFCCGKCAKNFAKDHESFAVKANQQLVATGQFAQTACPISGGDVDDEQASEVDGVTVKFCCHRCKGKVDAAEGDKKSELVFGRRFDKAFAKQ